MKKITKFGLATLLLASVGVSSAFASNTSWSTAGTIRTDVDKYINLNYFDEVIFDKVFATSNISNSGLELGAATKVNDIYLGSSYDGQLWGKLEGTNSKESNNDTSTNKIESKAKWNAHNFNVLVGLKDMGFKLYSYLRFDAGDSKITKTESSNGTTESENTVTTTKQTINPYNGTTTPYSYNNRYLFDIGWGGMKFNKNETLIKPYANIIIDVNHNSRNYEQTTETKTYNKTTNKYTKDEKETNITKNNLSFAAVLGFKAGSEFVWGKGTNFVQTLDASNKFNIAIPHAKPYIQTTKTTNNLTNYSSNITYTTKYVGKVDWTDFINTSYRFEYKPINQLTLAATASLNTTVSYYNPGHKEKTNDKNSDKSYEFYSNGSWIYGTAEDKLTTKTLTTTMYPSFALGLSYAVKPNFKVNFGYSGTIPTITITDSTVEKSFKSTKESYSNKSLACSTGNYTSSLSAGLVWDLNKYCTLDAHVDLFDGGDRAPSLNDIWKTNCSLGFTFKM